MAIRVMIVDDSAVVRGLMSRALDADPDIEVTVSAAHGLMALHCLKEQAVDVIVLDIEMPEMDGLTALPRLLEACPAAKVIMASSLAQPQAEATMRALSLGAADYLAKPTTRGAEDTERFYAELRRKVRALGAFRLPPGARQAAALPDAEPAPVPQQPMPALPPVIGPLAPIHAIGIASSTGGPQALLHLFAGLKGHLEQMPIFIAQHMPPAFTAILAGNIAKVSGKICHEGRNGDEVLPGNIYVAPGDYHMTVERVGHRVIIRTNQDAPENFCRPAADPMLRSLAAVYGRNLLAMVLTGMGHDGLAGAQAVIAGGGGVIAQDEASSVVWGMPRAVASRNLCRAVLPLDAMARWLADHAAGERS